MSSNVSRVYLGSSLYDCLVDGDLRNLKILLEEKHADPNVILPEVEFTPFHYVAGMGNQEFAVQAAQLFIDHQGDPNIVLEDGTTPVHIAANWGHVPMLKKLLKHGGDPWREDGDGCSAFSHAQKNDHVEAMEFLKQYSIQDVVKAWRSGSRWTQRLSCIAEEASSKNETPKESRRYSSTSDSSITSSNNKSLLQIPTVYLSDTQWLSDGRTSGKSASSSMLSGSCSGGDPSSKRFSVSSEIISGIYSLSIESSPNNETSSKSSVDLHSDVLNLESSKGSDKVIESLERLNHQRMLKENQQSGGISILDKKVSKNNSDGRVSKETDVISEKNISLLHEKTENPVSENLTGMSVTADGMVTKEIIAALENTTSHNFTDTGFSKDLKISPSFDTLESRYLLFRQQMLKNLQQIGGISFLEEKFSKSDTDAGVSKERDTISEKNSSLFHENTHSNLKDTSNEKTEDHVMKNLEIDMVTEEISASIENIATSNDFTDVHFSKNFKKLSYSSDSDCLVDSNVTKSRPFTFERRIEVDLTSASSCSKSDIKTAYGRDLSNTSSNGKFVLKDILSTNGKDLSSASSSGCIFDRENKVVSKDVLAPSSTSDNDLKKCTSEKLFIHHETELEGENSKFLNSEMVPFIVPAVKVTHPSEDLTDKNNAEIEDAVNIERDALDSSEEEKQKNIQEWLASQVTGSRSPSVDDYYTCEEEDYENDPLNTAAIGAALCVDNRDSLNSGHTVATVSECVRHTDEEYSISLVEERFFVNPVSAKEETESESGRTTKTGSETCDTDAVRNQLLARGQLRGPVTKTTKRVYYRQLLKDSKTGTPSKNSDSTYCREVQRSLESKSHLFFLDRGEALERRVAAQFSSSTNRFTWREGIAKTSFTYLLLDPQVTQNLPCRAMTLSPVDLWCVFLKSIFYIGKGKRSRPYSHLYEAISEWKKVQRKVYSTNLCVNKKIKRILSIWLGGQGVVCLHVFQNIIPAEAYTREAAMIDALGLNNLCNEKRGEYHGEASKWFSRDQRIFGIFLLHKAMKILLIEGERQLRPSDVGE